MLCSCHFVNRILVDVGCGVVCIHSRIQRLIHNVLVPLILLTHHWLLLIHKGLLHGIGLLSVLHLLSRLLLLVHGLGLSIGVLGHVWGLLVGVDLLAGLLEGRRVWRSHRSHRDTVLVHHVTIGLQSQRGLSLLHLTLFGSHWNGNDATDEKECNEGPPEPPEGPWPILHAPIAIADPIQAIVAVGALRSLTLNVPESERGETWAVIAGAPETARVIWGHLRGRREHLVRIVEGVRRRLRRKLETLLKAGISVVHG